MPKPPLNKLPFDYREAVMLITLLIGLSMFGFGWYMIGPWYVMIPGAAAFAEISGVSVIYFKLIASCYIISGAGMVWGGIKGQNAITRSATVLAFSMFAVMVVTRLITVGFTPVIWIFQLALLLVTAVLALTEGDK